MVRIPPAPLACIQVSAQAFQRPVIPLGSGDLSDLEDLCRPAAIKLEVLTKNQDDAVIVGELIECLAGPLDHLVPAGGLGRRSQPARQHLTEWGRVDARRDGSVNFHFSSDIPLLRSQVLAMQVHKLLCDRQQNPHPERELGVGQVTVESLHQIHESTLNHV
ncbi:MAG: hypothetical protein U0794_09850 [Isosphaeraceae bacterium]